MNEDKIRDLENEIEELVNDKQGLEEEIRLLETSLKEIRDIVDEFV